MASCPLEFLQGATFTQVYRWGAEPLVYKAVTAVPSLTPLKFTITAHAIPDGWSIALAEFSGLESLLAADWPPGSKDYYPITVVDSDTIALNTVDADRFETSGSTPATGTIAMLTPVSLAGVTAAFNIYPFPSPGSGLPVSSPVPPPTPLLTVTPVLDDTAKTITVTVTATQTTDLNPGQYAYALIVTSGAVVTVLDQGAIFVGVPGVTAAANL